LTTLRLRTESADHRVDGETTAYLFDCLQCVVRLAYFDEPTLIGDVTGSNSVSTSELN
jgi:hypothetical protein